MPPPPGASPTTAAPPWRRTWTRTGTPARATGGTQGSAAVGMDRALTYTACSANRSGHNCSCGVTPAPAYSEDCPELRCAPGMRLIGSFRLVCASNGTYPAWGATCIPVVCPENQRVKGHRCTPCGQGLANAAGDLATQGDTYCADVRRLAQTNFQFGRLAILARVGCAPIVPGEDESISWQLHFTQQSIGGGPLKQLRGTCAYNTALLAGTILFAFFLMWVQRAAHPKRGPGWRRALANIRCPGAFVMSFSVAQSGMVDAGWKLALRGDAVEDRVLGIGTLTLCFAVPVVVWVTVLRSSRFEARASPAADARDWPLRTFFLGGEEWQCGGRVGSKYFIRCYGVIFDAYNSKHRWFGMVELVQVPALALITAFRFEDAQKCEIRNWVLAAWSFVLFVITVIVRPMASGFAGLLVGLNAALQAGATVAMAVGFELGEDAEDRWFDAADRLLLGAAVLVMVRLAYDSATLLMSCAETVPDESPAQLPRSPRGRAAVSAARGAGTGDRGCKSGAASLQSVRRAQLSLRDEDAVLSPSLAANDKLIAPPEFSKGRELAELEATASPQCGADPLDFGADGLPIKARSPRAGFMDFMDANAPSFRRFHTASESSVRRHLPGRRVQPPAGPPRPRAQPYLGPAAAPASAPLL
eukprot:TRINITY_DN12238_c0_g1_i1.p1 TRINITY_DN12238_c0_g1~~TRINITY_DN12238_c0_g1_i1.p1  ORF type:complete len:645 (+),score=93.01 TRINITY_DN12238_c0_g1_i1:846-2780(+)